MDLLKSALEVALSGWEQLLSGQLTFTRMDEAVFLGALMVVCLMSVAVFGKILKKSVSRTALTLPALFFIRQSGGRHIRFIPPLLFWAGLLIFAIALCDPRSGVASFESSYPGRRMILTVDASGSMTGYMNAPVNTDSNVHFEHSKLKVKRNERFFTGVAAAKYFVELRSKGKYKDLMALVEFGNIAHVVTPFTTDYANIMNALDMIGEPEEYNRFGDVGTEIEVAILTCVELFRAFGFLDKDSAGSAIILFSDGEDSVGGVGGVSFDDIVKRAFVEKIPVYMLQIRKRGERQYTDSDWSGALERTGGKVFRIATENDIINALKEIDKLSNGTIRVRERTLHNPRFQGFAMTAACLWAVAVSLVIFVPAFRVFP